MFYLISSSGYVPKQAITLYLSYEQSSVLYLFLFSGNNISTVDYIYSSILK